MTQTVILGTNPPSIDEVIAVARGNAQIQISPQALEAMAVSRAYVDKLAHQETPVYGISTGFGALATRHIPQESRVLLQKSLIRSHAAGSGNEAEREVVRATMFLRLKTLTSGRTGVRPEVAETYAAILNAGITPIVYEFGSLGCSGDLAPLAHCALVAMGEGEARNADGNLDDVASLLSAAGISPLELKEKEGLALINGTDGMLGMLIMAIADLEGLCDAADLGAAMSVEALMGTDQVFRPELHQPLRPHVGQAVSAANMFAALAGSPIVQSHKLDDDRVQDAYSLRCAPQVTGAVRDTITHAKNVAQNELAASIDNPVILPSGEVTSNGNFHGAPVAYVLDFLAIAAADLGSICERRTDRLLDKNRNHGLPPFLAHDPGVDSGLMIAQYTQAGLVSDCKRLAVPASVDSIPSSAMQEDHVSMGWHAGRKLRSAVSNLTTIIAIEFMAAGRGLELRAPLLPGPVTRELLHELRQTTQGAGPDQFLAPEIQATREFIVSRFLTSALN